MHLPSILTFDAYQSLTAPSALYEHASDPEMVLRSGLVEETIEILDADPNDKDEMHKEIGDVLWYLSETLRHKGLLLKEVAGPDEKGYESFDDFQDDSSHIPSPIYTPEGTLFEALHNPQEALAVRVMRVIDTLNPKTDELWLNYDERPHLKVAVRDALICVVQVSNTHGIRLNEAASRTLRKIHGRARNPHVIDNADAMVESGRDRLKMDPWVVQLLLSTVRNK